MINTIDVLDEMGDIDFGSGVSKNSRQILLTVCTAVGWAVLLVGFVLAATYLTPPQRSAEADLFEAECQEKGVAP